MTHEYELFVSYSTEDRIWVKGNLLSALDAGGVKYLTEVNFQLGAPRIVEFERAVRQSKHTLLVLSPHYLNAHFNQYVDILVNSYGLETGSWPVIPMIIQPVTLPIRLSQLVALEATELDEWEQTLKRLFATLELPVPEIEDKAPGAPPFKGLLYFDVHDASLFFGRESLVVELAARLSLSPASGGNPGHFLAIVGASGSGKSSIARAGLIPMLTSTNLGWVYRIITPTAHPLKELAVTLTADVESVTAATTLIDDLTADPRSFDIATSRFLKRQNAPHLLLVVDQFEELFTACKDPAERKAFIDNLLHVTVQRGVGNVTLLLTLRADFYHHCAQYDNLRTALESHQAYIGPMTTDELRRAIEAPARQNGWDLEVGLVDVMLHDVSDEPGALPLLSHSLLETWQRRKGRILTLAGYHIAGGVRGAIAQTADRVYTALSPDSQRIARDIFLRLTELGEGTQDTRRRATLDELIPEPARRAEVEAVLKTLTDARLVTTEKDTAEVTHEALIREWPALREWLDENRAGLRLHRHLTESAIEWECMDRDAAELYRGVRLSQAWEWWQTEKPVLNSLERDFLEASRAEGVRQFVEQEVTRKRELEQAQKLIKEQQKSAQAQRQRAIYLTAGLIVAVILSILAFSLFQSSNRNLEEANLANTQSASNLEIARLGELSAQALLHMDDRHDLAMLLSIEAFTTSSSLQSRQALYQIWKHNPRLIQIFQGHQGSVSTVAFSPNGRILASGSDDGTIRLWDVAVDSPTFGQSISQPLVGNTNEVLSIAFSPDGQTLAAGGCGTKTNNSFCTQGEIHLWDVQSGHHLGNPLAGHTREVKSVVFSPNGRILATGSFDDTIRLWDVDVDSPSFEQQISEPLIGNTGGVWSVAFSPDGRMLAVGSIYAIIHLWDVDLNSPTFGQLIDISPMWHDNVVLSVAFSPNGRILASGAADYSIRLWDVAIDSPTFGQPIGGPLIGTNDNVKTVAFSPDGLILASGSDDGKIRLWDVAVDSPSFGQPISEPLTGHQESVSSVVFSPDGQTLASASRDFTIHLWDIDLNRQIFGQSNNRYGVTSIAFSPDGQILASALYRTIQLWDVTVGSPTFGQPIGKPFAGKGDGVSSIAFNPNGQILAFGNCIAGDDNICAQGEIYLWDVQNGNHLGEPLTGHTNEVKSVAFSPDGRILASGSYDRTIRLWDVAADSPTFGQSLGEPLAAHIEGVWSIAFSPDGRMLASASNDGTIRLWDVAVDSPTFGQSLGEPLIGHTAGVWSVAFSPDGQTLASGSVDRTIRFWNIRTGQPLGEPLIGSKDVIFSVAFSPDGQTLASAAGDFTVRLWDVQTRQTLGEPLQGSSAVFSPDGQFLASEWLDYTIRLWDVDPVLWMQSSCQRAGRNLTEAEWKHYLSWKGPYDLTHKTCLQWPSATELIALTPTPQP